MLYAPGTLFLAKGVGQMFRPVLLASQYARIKFGRRSSIGHDEFVWKYWNASPSIVGTRVALLGLGTRGSIFFWSIAQTFRFIQNNWFAFSVPTHASNSFAACSESFSCTQCIWRWHADWERDSINHGYPILLLHSISWLLYSWWGCCRYWNGTEVLVSICSHWFETTLSWHILTHFKTQRVAIQLCDLFVSYLLHRIDFLPIKRLWRSRSKLLAVFAHLEPPYWRSDNVQISEYFGFGHNTSGSVGRVCLPLSFLWRSKPRLVGAKHLLCSRCDVPNRFQLFYFIELWNKHGNLDKSTQIDLCVWWAKLLHVNHRSKQVKEECMQIMF